jgi:hypothetical protein
MSRPAVPDEKQISGNAYTRDPADLEAELKKYQGINNFIEKCGELSDVTDKFHHYEARLTAKTKAGLARPYRVRMYRHYKRNSLNHLRMAVNEIVRLLSQPKIIIHGNDLIRDDTEQPGFWSNVLTGAKRMIGMNTEQPQQQPTAAAGAGNGRY